MNYPNWQPGVPGGLVIAIVAVVHVFVSHFAVGGGAFLVLTEHWAGRSKDADLRAWLKRYSKFFVLVILVLGAVTGVGIWFTIGLVSPEATSSLIRIFVWGFAIEWVFFFIEIASALIYVYSWDRVDRRTHLKIGWIYLAAAWASLLVINGIVTFMLTPGRWLETRSFWDGFFNPTYLPSLAARAAMAMALAGMFALLRSGGRAALVRWCGGWVALGLVVLPACIRWYYLRAPDFSQSYLTGAPAIARQVASLGMALAWLALLVVAAAALAKPQWMNRALAGVVLLCGFGVMASGEYLREFVRKPYAINGYIYANDLRVSRLGPLSRDGVRRHAKWLDTADYGRQLFLLECGTCHSLDGYRAIRPRVRGWDTPLASEMLRRLPATFAPMPPFAGNDEDRFALAAYLASLNPPATSPPDGQRSFAIRCAQCHSLDGPRRPLKPSFAAMGWRNIDDVLQRLDAISKDMPPFTGTEAERQALAKWLERATR